MKKAFRFSLLICLCVSKAAGQILDDSSRQVYSLKTVFIRTESEMAANNGRLETDTSLNGFSEKLDFIRKDGREFQNLGTFGSASRPLLYELPASIGRRNGMNAFDALVPDKDKVLYYNTLSPFTSIRYMQGARQRAMLQAGFAVNPHPTFNLSGHYQRLTALRVMNVQSQDARETDHHSAWVSSNYRSRSGVYRAWGHYRHLNHLQYLTGGAKPGGAGFEDSLFGSAEIMKVRLFQDARNRDLRNALFISQQLSSRAGLYLRSVHSREKQVNRYGDSKPDSLYYGKDNFFFQAAGPAGGEPDSLFIQRTFLLWENSLWIGKQDSLSDFAFYLKRRDWQLENAFLPGSRHGTEWIPGLSFRKSKGGLVISFLTEARSGSEYDAKGNIGWKNFRVSARLFSFLPSLVQEEFYSKNLLYSEKFTSTRAWQVKLEKNFALNGISVRPWAEVISLNKGIAFDSTFRPFQASGQTFIRYVGLDFQSSFFGRLHSSGRFTAVSQTGTLISGMPDWLLHSSHWFDLVKNRKAYAVQLGFSLDWRTSWQSEIFCGPNAQWYLQSVQKVPSYWMMNSFVHLRIDRVRVYFRVHNTLQGLGTPGYFAAPGYPGQRRLFELGLDWTFFD